MKGDRAERLAGWKPKPSAGLSSKANEHGFPTIVYRTPSRLVEECERAFDEGLLLAALSLVVTIPDVCSRLLARSDYRSWCERYLHLSNDGKKRAREREKNKISADVSREMRDIAERGVFTVSDLYQLRCAVLHAASSSIDQKGADYSPYRTIGVCVQGDAENLVASFGHAGYGTNEQENCSYDCVVRLEGIISLMAKGVCEFLEEHPECDKEYTGEDRLRRTGVVDYRPLPKEVDC